jgi:hypothetical protein
MLQVENLLKILKEYGDSFAIQNESILVRGVTYYFIKKNDLNVYKGTFNRYSDYGYAIFDNVEIYNGNMFQKFTHQLITPFIDKIYYL